MHLGVVALEDEPVRRPPDGRLDGVADHEVVFATVECEAHVASSLRRRGRVAGLLLGHREGCGSHTAAALLHHCERGEEVPDLGLRDAEVHGLAFDVSLTLEVANAVAVDHHAAQRERGARLDRGASGAAEGAEEGEGEGGGRVGAARAWRADHGHID